MIRDAYTRHDPDRALLYTLVAVDINVPYWGSHFIDLFEKHLWSGEPPVLACTATEADALYRQFMELLLSVSPNNDHAVDVAVALLEGNHGYTRDAEKAREMLETSKSSDASFYLGWM